MSEQNEMFYVGKQAIIFAQSYFTMGYSLYSSVLSALNKSNKTEDVWKMWPGIVNISFSCEICLKLLYEAENNETTRGHRLYEDLFSKLSKNIQTAILNRTINFMLKNGIRKYTECDFFDDIKLSDNVFQNERYAFEYMPGKASNPLKPTFILSFAEALLSFFQ